MPRSFNIITNLTNGAGLQRDYELLKRLLESYGHKVTGTMFNAVAPTFRRHDVNIFLEVVTPQWIQYASENWIVPNTEWWYPCWDPFLPRINKVLLKTQDALRLWIKKIGPQRCRFIGFESNDFYVPDIPRQPIFLHMAGKSETKNTMAVTAAWRHEKLPYPLVAVAFKPEIVRLCQNIPNVTHVERYTDAEVIQAMNECRFHIMPSKYEGFGHYIHEAVGCGGIVITTDAPPMNEFDGIGRELLIPVERKLPRLKAGAVFNEVSPRAVADAVHKAAALSEERIAEIATAARAAFLADREYFRAQFKELAQ